MAKNNGGISAAKMFLIFLVLGILIAFFGFTYAVLIIAILAVSSYITKKNKKTLTALGITNKKIPSLGGIVKIIFYSALLILMIFLILASLEEVFDNNSIKNKVYVKSQSGEGIVGFGENNSIRIVGGNSKEGTTFVLKTTEPVNGGPSFVAWITGTNNSTISVRMIDVKKIGANAEFKRIAISSKQFGYGAMYKIGYMYEEFSNGRIKTSMKPKAIDPHADRREYDIEIEIYTPTGGIVDLEKVIIKSSW
ncbi:MAG: hypothetical protein WA063_04260 [Minisyncoccia bacterium]